MTRQHDHEHEQRAERAERLAREQDDPGDAEKLRAAAEAHEQSVDEHDSPAEDA